MSGLLTHEHVPYVGLREPSRYHPAVHAGEEYGFRLEKVE